MLLSLCAVLCGCQCVQGYAAETAGVLDAGETNFEISFGEGVGTPHIHVLLAECTGTTTVELSERAYMVDPDECRTESIYAESFENSTALMRVQSSEANETLITVVSPGTDCDDGSELVVESIRQL